MHRSFSCHSRCNANLEIGIPASPSQFSMRHPAFVEYSFVSSACAWINFVCPLSLSRTGNTIKFAAIRRRTLKSFELKKLVKKITADIVM